MLAIKIYNYLTIKALALVRNLVSFQFYLIGIDTCLLYTNVLNSTFCRVLIFLTERKDKETQLLNLQSVIICLGMGLSHAANEKPGNLYRNTFTKFLPIKHYKKINL